MTVKGDCVLFEPWYIERALMQTVDIGSTHAIIPFLSWEAWAHSPGSEFLSTWMGSRWLCLNIDLEHDPDELVMCLRPLRHIGEHGKPGDSHLVRQALS